MESNLEALLSGSGFMPHGHCYLWTPSLVWLHTITDGCIVLSYYCIPLALVYIVYNRRDMKFGWMFVWFAVFILACGTTHLMEIWNIWHSAYWLAGGIKAITAIASVITCFRLFGLIPLALALPSADALEQANAVLKEEIQNRRDAEERLSALNATLEARVARRTSELHASNEELKRQITERKEIEEQLRSSLRDVNDLTAALNEHSIVAITNPQGRINYVNDKFCKISKYSREELLGQDHRIINSGFHPKEFIHDLWTTIAHGQVWHGEIKNRAKDGSFYWVDTTIVPFLNEDGKPRQYVAIRTDITDRKLAEEGAAQLAAIVESTDEAIVGKDLNGIVTSWNIGAEKLFGYTAEEMVGQPITRLIPQERLHEEAWILDQVRKGEGIKQFETLRLRKDGVRFVVSVTVSAIRDRSGKIIGASKVARDITERKSIENRLRSSLKEVTDLKAALDEHAIVAITDPRGLITFVNDKFCAISKYSRGELLGQDHRIINSGHHSKAFFHDLWSTIGQGKVWQGEIKNRAKDGSYYWVDTTIVPFLNEQGKPRQYVAIRTDITDRIRATEALAESEEQLHTLVDAMSQLAWMANPDGSIYWYNQRWYDYTGTTPGEMEGWGWQKVHAPEFLPKVMERWKASIATGDPLEMDFPLRSANGTYRWFLTRAFALKDPSGKILRWCGTNTDITQLREAEQEIQKLNSELEERVLERTAQLQASNERLEAANRELEAFSYSVSHDLRAPLRAVDGFSQAVLEDFGSVLPEQGHHYLKTLRAAAQNMGTLIDNLLTFSRLSRAPISKQKINTAQQVQAVLEDVSLHHADRQVEVRIGDLPHCRGDQVLLHQVWVNLLSNAFKYTRKREKAVVEIGCNRTAEGNVYFVRDNGTGFDMKYADKLFGVFQRLHRAEDFEGTGVGLAIVQRIIHRHGGKIWVEAAQEQGATFFFTTEEPPNV